MPKLEIFKGFSLPSYSTLALMLPHIITFSSHLVNQVTKQNNVCHVQLNENEGFSDFNILLLLWNLKIIILGWHVW